MVTPISKLPVRDSTTLQPVTVPKGYNKQFWVILKVPFNASSGNYSGKIIIESNTRIIQELKLNLQVLPIELSKTNMEYSLFYRGKITENGSISSEEKTTAQFTAEIQNMYDHGITNPTIYPYIGSYGLFQTHETAMCKELSIRQNIGLDNTRLYFCGYVLPDTIKHFKDLFAQYGVVDIYQYGPDEQDINITESRDYITSVHNSGGKYFVAEWIKSYAESVPDVLDLVIAGNIWPDVVDSYHSYGHKIFLYNCPQTVPEYPHTFRLNYGLLLWQKNYDGTMDYAYQHSFGDIWNDFDSPICRDHVFAYPTMDGVIDTIQWEGFREGVDDVRYLTTLQNKIALAKSEGKNTSEAENYLANLKNSSLSSMDLDEVRGQIIYYTLSLQNDLNSTNQNTSGNDSTNENNYTNLTILQKPIADFWESPKSGNVPLNVTFTDNSTGSPTAWNWNFGDGTINSTLQNPVHTYSTAGDYTVVFTASNAAGSSTVTGLIRVTPPEDSISDGSAASKLKVFDNRLREASPDTVFQSSPYIDVGGMNSVRYRDVILFNLSEYTSSAEISNATLSLYWYYPAGKTRPSDTVIEIYRPASSWNPGYVSWNKRDRGIAWKNPGGDWYDKKGVLQGSTPYATLTIKGSALPDNRYYELNVTDLVKEYVSGKYENTGFLIKARAENNNYIAFYSSDNENTNQVPNLNIKKKEPIVPVPIVNMNSTVIGAKDNRLREASPEIVFQNSPFIDIGGMNNVKYRDMVWFNLSEYTGSANVNNATLSLYWYYPAGISRPSDTVIEVYRPASSWNPGYVSWNKRDRGIAWKNPGGDWYDKKGVLQGSTPYATLTIKGSALPDNRYYELNVTDLVKEYVSGKYENTGFLIKARTERNNYIAFYSSDCGNENQIPKIRLVYS
ncbi:hypothetical protein MSMAP_1325 [Methanosarcina mazei SarPi]|uniref:PKD domain-containing protein n=1 Tax=Methanosarcina mazei SarPi TaxID=1434115 RepID=A0A0E3RAM7_METMZ|nr:hypothetical protein MSMAP_1325 [Methanosarcina mazei SarPi]